MSEVVERVARALCERGLPRVVCEEFARAAILAMREPTEGMLAIGDHADNGDDHNLGRTAAAVLWQAWIDEALK